jgi:Biotin-lipoyl like
VSAITLELRSLPRVQTRVTKRWISVPVEARVEMQPSSKIYRCMPKVAAILLVAIVLAGCRQEVSQAAGPPPVTVAQPVKRTITEWDEFTGRFEAIEEVQVRVRVGGFVTRVEFKDGDMVRTGDLLYLIDSRPFVHSTGWRCFIAVTKWTAALVVPYRKWLSTPADH